MDFDITIADAPSTPQLDFDGFVGSDLDPVARAVAVVVGPDAVEAALAQALHNARRDWKLINVDDRARRYVFADAVRNQHVDPHGDIDGLVSTECAVAHHGLAWPIETIAKTLGLSSAQVADHLDHADHHFLVTESGPFDAAPPSLHERVAQALRHAQPNLLGALETEAEHERARRRRRSLAAVGAVGALLLIVALAGQFLLQQDRPPPAEDVAQAVTEVPLPAPTPSAAATGNAAVDDSFAEPVPEVARTPDFMAPDGAGGFVGLRRPPGIDQSATFSRSSNGRDWIVAARAILDSTIDHFERSGEHYVAWGTSSSESGSVVTNLGVSSDLADWQTLELAIDDQAPHGILLDTSVAAVSVRGPTVLALVTTTIDISFNDLLLVEGYTCGRTITTDEISVNLCNGHRFEVLSYTAIASLPARNRLFLSTNGGAFAPVSVPFGNQTTPRLTSTGEAHLIADETGVAFAASADGQTWQSIATARPPFDVRAAASSATGGMVGLGEAATVGPVVFHSKSGTTTALPVREVIADSGFAEADSEIETLEAIASRGPSDWTVYVYAPGQAGWLLSSADGLAWRAVPVDPAAGVPQLLVGNTLAVLRWTSASGTTTETIPLP